MSRAMLARARCLSGAARACGARRPRTSRLSSMAAGAAVAAPCTEVVVAPAVSAPAAVSGLEPAALWRFFGELTQIPRPSKREGAVLAYLRAFAAERGLEVLQIEDTLGGCRLTRACSG